MQSALQAEGVLPAAIDCRTRTDWYAVKFLEKDTKVAESTPQADSRRSCK